MAEDSDNAQFVLDGDKCFWQRILCVDYSLLFTVEWKDKNFPQFSICLKCFVCTNLV